MSKLLNLSTLKMVSLKKAKLQNFLNEPYNFLLPAKKIYNKKLGKLITEKNQNKRFINLKDSYTDVILPDLRYYNSKTQRFINKRKLKKNERLENNIILEKEDIYIFTLNEMIDYVKNKSYLNIYLWNIIRKNKLSNKKINIIGYGPETVEEYIYIINHLIKNIESFTGKISNEYDEIYNKINIIDTDIIFAESDEEIKNLNKNKDLLKNRLLDIINSLSIEKLEELYNNLIDEYFSDNIKIDNALLLVNNEYINDDKKYDLWDKSYCLLSSDLEIFDFFIKFKVVIFDIIDIKPKKLLQTYKKNEDNNCLINPIIAYFNNKIDKLKTPAKKRYYTGKINYLISKYKNKGVKDSEIKNICNDLSISIIIHDIHRKDKQTYTNTRTKHNEKTFNFINSEIDHVCIDSGEIHKISQEDLNEIYNTKNNILVKKSFNNISTLFCDGDIYTLDNDYSEVSQEFNKIFNGCQIDAYKTPLLVDFILRATKITGSLFYTEDDTPDLQIDQIKSYTSFKASNYYSGFPTRINSFFSINENINVSEYLNNNKLGFSMIENVSFSNITNKNIKNHINTWFNRDYIQNGDVYANIELLFLWNNNVRFNIKMSANSNKRLDFDFSEDMIHKKMNNVPYYSLWTGQNMSVKDYVQYSIKSDKKDFLAHVSSNYQYSKINKTIDKKYECDFRIEKETLKTKCHISAYILAYQRINLLEQLFEMEHEKINKVVMDGIYFKNHKIKLINKFRLKPIINNAFMKAQSEKIINEVTFKYSQGKSEFNYLLQENNNFELEEYNDRERKNKILYNGMGGSGKTTYAINRYKNMDVCYVAPSNLLKFDKSDDHISIATYSEVIRGHTYIKYKKTHDIFILDEITMVAKSELAQLFNIHKYSKFIIIGDYSNDGMPYQCVLNDPLYIKPSNIKTKNFEVNYRTKCPQLLELMRLLRLWKDENKTTEYVIDNLKLYLDKNHIININQLKELYNINDYVLTAQKKDGIIKYYNDLLEKEKYLITKNNKKYSNGEILHKKPDELKESFYEKRNNFTIHQVQGRTIQEKIFISEDGIFDGGQLYVAVSRAVSIDQIYIFNICDVEKNKMLKCKESENKPKKSISILRGIIEGIKRVEKEHEEKNGGNATIKKKLFSDI